MRERYEHVYVVVRFDDYGELHNIENRISLTKAFRSVEAARAEVTRLSQINKEKASVYFWKVARLQYGKTGVGETKG